MSANSAYEESMALFSRKHVIPILMYIADSKEGCLKTDIYSNVAYTPNIPDRFEEMKACGLIEIVDVDRRSQRIVLTPKGKKVTTYFRKMEHIMSSS